MFDLPKVKRLYELVDSMPMASAWKAYIDAFLYGCRIKNLSDSTISGYAERLGYLARYLEEQGVDIERVTRAHLQEYVLSLINNPRISDATVNGRITVYKIFWGYLVDEGIWERANPAAKLKKIKAKKTIRDVLNPEDISPAQRPPTRSCKPTVQSGFLRTAKTAVSFSPTS